MTLTLGFSPCPNDTFIFDALVNGGVDTGDLRFEVVMEDVETLNRWATEGKLQITKLSYAAFLHCTSRYQLLESGSALGHGVGPLVIANEASDTPAHSTEGYISPAADAAALTRYLNKARIATPGRLTTANMLLTMAFPRAVEKQETLFSNIEDAVLRGDADAGVIIHEGRFTYAGKGLSKLIDLGQWWEETTGTAIPLGGIAVRRDVPRDVAIRIDALLQKSIAAAWKAYPVMSQYVRNNAQEMDEAVMRSHIELYVNNYTSALGPEGHAAIDTLFRKAASTGFIPEDVLPDIFVGGRNEEIAYPSS